MGGTLDKVWEGELRTKYVVTLSREERVGGSRLAHARCWVLRDRMHSTFGLGVDEPLGPFWCRLCGRHAGRVPPVL